MATTFTEVPVTAPPNPSAGTSQENLLDRVVSKAAFTALNDANILTLCRRASKIHFEMILIPTALVSSRIRPDFRTFYIARGSSWHTRIILVILGFFVVGLPGLYAHTIMPYPCKSTSVELGQHEGEMKEMTFRQDGCEVEDKLLRCPWMLGGTLMGVSLLLTILLDLQTRLMYCIYYSCGKPTWLLNLKRLMWRPILMFWYGWIHHKIPNLKYCNDIHVFPPLYSPPSVIVCWVYFVLIVEMFAVAAKSGHIAVGIVLAYAMGEGFLRISDRLLQHSSDTEIVTAGEIREWLPAGWNIGSTTIFDRLHELIQDGKSKLYLSAAELLSLEQLDTKVHLKSPSDRLEGDDSLDGVGVITQVYIVDTCMLVDLVTGVITSIEEEIGTRGLDRDSSLRDVE